MFLGSDADNHHDAMSKGRHAHHETHASHRLTVADVKSIRAALASGVTRSALALRFGVDPATIRAIDVGRTWRGV